MRPVSVLTGKGLRRRLSAAGWLWGNLRVLLREMRRADAVMWPSPAISARSAWWWPCYEKADVRTLLRQLGFAKDTPQRFSRWFMETLRRGARDARPAAPSTARRRAIRMCNGFSPLDQSGSSSPARGPSV